MGKFKELFAAKDMTEGTLWKRIVEFAIPMLIGNVASSFIILLILLLLADILVTMPYCCW